MKSNHSLFRLLALTLALLIVLTGCGGKKTANTEAAKPADDAKTESAPESGEKVTLTYYGFSDWVASEPFDEVYEAAVAQFEEENPGFTIELQSDPWGDWEQKYKTMFASGNPADIFIVNNPEFPTFANSGNLLNLDEYVDDNYFDQFFPGVQSMYQWQGDNMGIAFTTDCRILWYNENLFEQAGLDPDAPPTTWAELSEYANTITEKTGVYGFGMDLGLKELPTAAAYCASDSSIITVGNDGSITPNVDTPEFRDYLQLLVDMKPAYEPDYAVLNHHDVSLLYVEEQVAMIIGNTLASTDIYEKDFWRQALVPKYSAESDNGSFGGGFGICVSNRTEHPEQATKFAQILCSAAYNAGLVSDVPASDGGLAQSEFVNDPNMAVYLEQIEFARQAQPKTLYYAEIEAAAYDTVVEVVVGDKPIDTAITELEAKILDIVG